MFWRVVDEAIVGMHLPIASFLEPNSVHILGMGFTSMWDKMKLPVSERVMDVHLLKLFESRHLLKLFESRLLLQCHASHTTL